MTVQEIITLSETRYPPTANWTDAQQVQQMNEDLKQIFRELQTVNKYTTISEKDTALYALPTGLTPENIQRVLMSDNTFLTLQTGTVAVSGDTVTGTNTNFTSSLDGQYIVVNDETRYVESVDSTTQLTVSVAFSEAVTGKSLYLCDTVDSDETFDEYGYVDYADYLSGNRMLYQWYYDLNNNIGIYPVPSESGRTITIIYLTKPTALSSSALTAVPDLPEEYHMLLAYGLMAEVAASGVNPDMDSSNNFRIQFQALMNRAIQNRYKMRSKSSTKIRPRTRPYRNRQSYGISVVSAIPEEFYGTD